MPARNVYFALIVIIVSLFVASKTSLREQVLRNAARELEKRSLEAPSSQTLLEGALAGLADAVGDAPYTQYLPPARETDYMREIQGRFAGIGVRDLVKDGETGEFYFVPMRRTPASDAGLKLGDRIVEVDDESVKPLSLFDLTEKLRGDEKTAVKLKIRPRTSIRAFADAGKTDLASDADPAEKTADSDNLREVELTRAVVQQDVVSGDRLDENGDWIHTLKDYPKIGYVAIEQFADATTPQTLAALSTLEKAGVPSVVLDFRGNPGGFLPDAVAICDEFVKAGAPIVEVRNRNGDVEQLYRATGRPKKTFRVVVLVDGESASASEIVAAALQDSGIAAVGGERSYGKGTIQSLFKLPCEFGLLRATTAEFYRPSGTPIRRRRDSTDDEPWGVSPDAPLAVEETPAQRFHRRRLRSVRVSGPENAVLDERTLAFVAEQTNDVLRRAAQTEDAFGRLEALAELGIDPEAALKLTNPANSATSTSDAAADPAETAETAETETSEKAENPFATPFEPAGRAPYFDPQLDRAVDYLLGVDAAPEDSSNPEN